MLKATIKLDDGTKITIEGSPEDIARTKKLLISSKSSHKKRKRRSKLRKSMGPHGLILELKSEGFFDKPKSITEVRDKLQEKAYYYPLSSLSPALIRLVKLREIGRLKREGKWWWVKR